MLDWTDRHCRFFFRLLAKSVKLYTEMITTGALLQGDVKRFLAFDESEHPIALQLGGSDPHDLAQCARMVEHAGYDEINLNSGCPSDRVQSGRFGACLMAEPEWVADCVQAMQDIVSIPVTVKTRIGIDDQDSYEALMNFIAIVSKSGCEQFIIHARKAWLSGLSPKENREIPPLRYDMVYQLKKDFPHLQFTLNGGVKTIEDIKQHLQKVDGVMLGRQAYHEPYLLHQIAHHFFGEPLKSRQDILHAFLPYVEKELAKGTPLHSMTRHILNLFHAEPGARAFRRHLTLEAHKPLHAINVIRQAINLTSSSNLDQDQDFSQKNP